jgi:hypothetical protein
MMLPPLPTYTKESWVTFQQVELPRKGWKGWKGRKGGKGRTAILIVFTRAAPASLLCNGKF